MDINQKTLEKHQKLLEKRVYLSPKEAQEVQKAMKNKAKQISVEHNLEYHCAKSTIFKRLYTALNEKFEVSTYRELPSIEFHNVLLAIQTLKIYTKDLKELNYQLDFDDDL